MRILFAAGREKSIFLYLVPLAWALRSAGHEVRVASQPAFAPVITQAGLTAVPVGRNHDPWRLTALTPDGRAGLRRGIPAPYDVVEDPTAADFAALRTGVAAAVNGWHKAGNVPMVAELVEFARAWEPDLVIWEPMTYAGPIAAKACGAAHARLLFGIDVYGAAREIYRRLNAAQPEAERADPLADWLGSYGRKYGFDYTEDLATGHFTIDQFPKSLQLETDSLDHVRMQYIPYGGAAVVPEWLWASPERPRVAVTLGLTATEVFDGYNVPLADILADLATLDIEVVATVTEAEQARLPRLPDNVRITSYVPWHALAPTCAAVVHHGGAATLATTSRHAVPQLALHYHFDQPILGRKLAEHGAGLEIGTTQATGAGVRSAVHRLLTEPAFRDRARDLTAEILGAPSPSRLVGRLEQLTVKNRA
ncbi:activator-dependent family glycosyltransferase [Actinoplanes sp. NEAU-A12]|uniref:Activator-dependent family glycosyltransferase n=1 Tax=Actinoplanes sandaracinus TaxID=3045177 RepID=A0ABT6WZH6_9ACTN|nr:activator-dependent family glycosyltransferase [Actinoplanes sandaracinus]MDI6105160.1 activator-dependent family glycosyltransferase [Actinoplanes sandaracinus]